jgi:hypothetical protein
VKECNICRENHDESRELSYDGRGVNSCDKYRSRLATFSDHAPKFLCELFTAAPKTAAERDQLRNSNTELLTAMRAALPALILLGNYIGNEYDGGVGIPAFDRCGIIAGLNAAITNSEALRNQKVEL